MPKLELTFDLKASHDVRRYSRGDVIGSIHFMYHPVLGTHRWHWWGSETEWSTFEGAGFATCEEALRDFSLNSHPEPIEFDGLDSDIGGTHA